MKVKLTEEIVKNQNMVCNKIIARALMLNSSNVQRGSKFISNVVSSKQKLCKKRLKDIGINIEEISYYNYLAIELLEKCGNKIPSEGQINTIEKLLITNHKLIENTECWR